MKSSRAATLAAIGFAMFVIPLSYVVAADPLVLCDGVNCQLCSFASLAQTIIKFTILIAIPIAAILFAYAGALYITARGSTGQIEKAHGIFGKVALGFVLALSGWLIVNTILVTIAKPSSFSSKSDFFTIQCVSNRPMTATLNDLLSGTPNVGSGNNTCPSDHPVVQTQSDTITCCKSDGTDCQLPPKVDPTCTTDFPSYDSGQKKCCKANDSKQCVEPRPDTQCTTDYPKYDSKQNQCCKLDNPNQCQAAKAGQSYKDVSGQLGDASSQLQTILTCMGNSVNAIPGGFAITSISDSNGGVSCYRDHPTWLQCSSDPQSNCCYHSRNSCHYGGPKGYSESYAADIRTRDLTSDQLNNLQQGAQQCGAQLNWEGTHLHVSSTDCEGL